MNGAHALLATLIANDVTTCFANPGTSEMHFVAGLDETPSLRAILCLFEGVATGAADGYARVSGTPASTLLHLGPGFANGWANLHNARRARVPLINIVGDHATYHARYDAPLQSDIGALAGALEGWFLRTMSPDDVARDTAAALRAAYGPPGAVATLLLPADASWGPLTSTPTTWPRVPRPAPRAVAPDVVRDVAHLLRTSRSALLLGEGATSTPVMHLAERAARSTSSRVILETFPAIFDHGQGVASPERLIYLSEFAIAQLSDVETIVLVGAKEPVGFFAYPDVASQLRADGCRVITLSLPGDDAAGALEALVEELGAPDISLERGDNTPAPTGALNAQSVAGAVAATMPEGLIIADESNTSGLHLYGATRFAPPHRVMTLTGGSIGFGLPVALGAAVASGSRVLALESDGSFLYTPQALWTMAREQLDVTVVALSNRSYAILNLERDRVGVSDSGATSQRMLDLDDPTLDFCAMATALGVPAVRAETAEQFVAALERSYATPGPMLIEAVLPKGLG